VPNRRREAFEEITDTAALANLTAAAASVSSYEAFEAALTSYRE